MENKERLEWKLLNDMSNFLHINMLNSQEDSAKLIYEFCYLRLLSLKTFKDIESFNDNVNLEVFINVYRQHLDRDIKEDLVHVQKDDLEVHFMNTDRAIELAYKTLEDIEMYKYSLKNINHLLRIFCSYNGNVFKNLMLIDFYDGSRRIFNTPEQICKLSNYLLDINDNDDVLDICSGYGNYLVNIINCNGYNSLTGIEINRDLSLISDIRLMALSSNYSIINDNVFHADLRKKYDKVFCNYPWGLRYEKYELDFIHDRLNDMTFKWEKVSGSSIDWLFINLTISMMKNTGKAIVMMPAGPLFKTIDIQYRKDLIENNYIESVIKIPVLTKYTSIPQYLLVLGNNSSDKIKFIDISNQIDKISPFKINMNMSKVFEILNDTNSQLTQEVSKKELEENNYILTVENYVEKKEVNYYNPKKLSDFVIDVFRGYQITSKEQKELESEFGEYEVLLISDINDGVIASNLTKINPIKGKFDRYLIKENDLIISSKGTRIKIAVVEDIKDRKIIASGNLIVLRLDTTKINPNFLEMYLNSSDGQTILNRIQTGAVIISINPSKLIEITISTLPIQKQNIIAEKYRSKKKQLQLAKEHVLKLEQEQDNFFESNIKEMLD